MEPIQVFDIDEQEVGCYYCIAENDHSTYKRGEAFLAGPDHPPWDGNANYICKRHLCDEAVTP